jgi:BirA family transcriptional regulator, biotin operon repressor / biotin---[acetyl-CoA-carboxylase] ligase
MTGVALEPSFNEQGYEELILGLLADAPDDYLQPDALCGKLGLSHPVVFRQIGSLRSKGYRIDLRPLLGYRLVEVPDRLTSLELGPLLNTNELGRTVHAFEEVTSTNDVAQKLAEEDAPHGTLVIAEQQTNGRGRHGRSWASEPRENLTFSLVLRPQLPVGRAAELTLVAAVAIAKELRGAGFPVAVKWPNDLLIEGRKVAGFLSEMSAEEGRLRYLVLGIGLNVNARSFAPELSDRATSLRQERGEPLPRALLLAALLGSLESSLDVHAAEGFSSTRALAREWSATLGREVRIEEAGRVVAGLATDIDESGALLVRAASGAIERVWAGDVSLG